MKSAFFFFRIVLLAFIWDLKISCQAEVIEAADMSRALSYASSGTLYVFDLDNTLMEPRQHLGSDQWVTYMLNRLVQQGLSMRESLDRVIPCWIEIMKKTEMKLVDPEIPALLERLKKKRVSHIGLTKRDPAVREATLAQLERLHIAFAPSESLKEGYLFEGLEGTVYSRGVIFAAATIDKGASLLAYLKRLEKMPSRIVVIDDKEGHLSSMAAAVEPLGIPFVGIRYGGADKTVKAFDPQVADVQLEYFQTILSDEEALQLLRIRDQVKKKSP